MAIDIRALDDMIAALPAEARSELLTLATEKLARNKIADYRPYAKQREFHGLGRTMRERLLRAGNQNGKSFCVGSEASYHLTGLYPDVGDPGFPDGWQGRRFDRPTVVWASGETAEATRDNPQRVLLGLPGETGTGAIPADYLGDYGMASGTADLYDYIKVRHHTNGVADGWSIVRFKYYAQGRRKWQGPPVDFVWFDEEPPEDIYDEGLARTIATGGMAAMSFTPLQGMSSVVLRFLGGDATPDRADINMTIEDAEHISAEERARIIASFPAHERDARAKGIPTLGSGMIFPVVEDDIVVEPFKIPDFWKHIAGIDFGWDHPTGAAKLAYDADNDVVYLVADYRASELTPVLHAAALKPWGDWLPWAWPHDGLQHDKGSGEQLAENYRSNGLNMLPDKATHPPGPGDKEGQGGNGVEAGVQDMLERMQTGRWKVFSTCQSWLAERRLYHRKDGKIVKERDDVLCLHGDTRVWTRYGLMPISVLVGTRGEVLTIEGKLANYKNCRMTQADADVVCVEFEDGATVTCTPNHKFLTSNGWVEAAHLVGLMCHNAVSSSRGAEWKKLSGMARGTPDLEDTGDRRSNSFIGQFGKSVMGLYHRATTSITRMATGTITPLRTLRCLKAGSTFRITKKAIPEDHKQHWTPYLIGGNPMLAARICRRWASAISISCTLNESSVVSAVVSSLLHKTQAITGFVQTLVSQNGGGYPGLITSRVYAVNAETNSEPIDSSRSKYALAHAAERHGSKHQKDWNTSRVLRVTSAGRSDVYCLEVPGVEAFAVENGVIVHNCASRYAYMMLRFAIPKREKIPDWKKAMQARNRASSQAA